MAQIIWTKSALNELNEIAEYIALHNPVAAPHLVEKIFTKNLGEFLQNYFSSAIEML